MCLLGTQVQEEGGLESTLSPEYSYKDRLNVWCNVGLRVLTCSLLVGLDELTHCHLIQIHRARWLLH